MKFYAPLNTLKAVGRDIWVVDGPEISFYGMPFFDSDDGDPAGERRYFPALTDADQ